MDGHWIPLRSVCSRLERWFSLLAHYQGIRKGYERERKNCSLPFSLDGWRYFLFCFLCCSPERRYLPTLLSLYFFSTTAKEHLLQLCKEEEQAQKQRDKKTTEEEEQERKAKEKENAQRTAVIQQLLEEVPLDVMKAPITVQNVEMNVHILSGMFFATGEASPLLKMVSELEHYSGEKLQNVSNGEGEEEDDEHQRRRKQMIVLQNQNEFVVGKSVRDHLLILCHEHERVMQILKEVCNRFEEESIVLADDINAPMMIRMKEGEGGELMVNAVIHENLRKIIGLVERVKEEQERLWRETEQRAQRQMEERTKREEEAARVRMR
ncbi:hypothetical protein QOT17_024071 [Balamuthia mandrillaris]